MRFLLIGGTADSRELAREIYRRGHRILISALTEYGADLAYQDSGLWDRDVVEGQTDLETSVAVRYGAFAEDSLAELLRTQGIDVVVDATHPYAMRIHDLAEVVCRKEKIPYFRWERPMTALPEDPLIHCTKTLIETAKRAAELGRRILLTTGGNSLSDWLRCEVFREKEIFVRVLPTSSILAKCEGLGLKPRQIIAAQGPFSQAWNEAMLKQLQIEVVIAKDSGKVGGTPEKIAACINIRIPIVVLERPRQQIGYSEEAVGLFSFVSEMEDKLRLWK